MKILRNILLGLVALVVIVIGVVAVLLATLDVDPYRPQIASALSEATGREVTLGGELALALSLNPALVVRELTIANADWATDDRFVEAREVALSVSLWPLLTGGGLKIDRILLDGVAINLEQAADGRVNWAMAGGDAPAPGDETVSPEGGPAQLTEIDALAMRDLALRFRRPDAPAITFALAEANGQLTRDGLALSGEGSVGAEPLNFEISGGDPSLLMQADQPWPVTIRAGLANLTLSLDGSLTPSAAGTGEPALDAVIEGRIEGSLARLGAPFGLALPGLDDITLAGQLNLAGQRIALDDLALNVAGTALAGEATLDAGRAVPYIAATLQSGRFDLSALEAGAAPPAGEGDDTPARLIPDFALPTELLRSANADITASLGELITPIGPISDLVVTLKLADGVLSLNPVSLSAFSGDLAAAARLDGSLQRPALGAEAALAGLDYGALLKAQGVTERVTGTLDGSLDLSARGADRQSVLQSVDGGIEIVTGRGEVSSRLLQALAGDILSALTPNLARRDVTVLNCAVARLDIGDGVARLDGFLIDTDRLTLSGVGAINLLQEEVDLLIRPRVKDEQLSDVSPAVRVKGSLTAPEIQPDAMSLVQGGAALLFGGVNPVGMQVPRLPAGVDGNACVAALDDENAGGDESGAGGLLEGLTGGDGSVEERLQGVGEGLRNLFGR